MRAPTRRQVLVTGGVGVGLVVAWALWPREFRHNLNLAEGETAFDAHLKIGRDGRVAVAALEPKFAQALAACAGLSEPVRWLDPALRAQLSAWFAAQSVAQLRALAQARDLPLEVCP